MSHWRALWPDKRIGGARLRAAFWVLLGLASWPLGWMNSVALVWMASVYANVESGMASAEAADNREVLRQLAIVREDQIRMRALLVAALNAREGGQ